MPYKMIQKERLLLGKARTKAALSVRQTAVLDDLRKLIAAEGFRHFRVADFASRLSCSTSLLYRIAESRDELVYRTIKSWQEFYDDQMRALDPNQPCLAVLKQAATVMANMHDPLSAQTIEDIKLTPSIKHVVDDFDQRLLFRIETLMERGIASGEIVPIDPRLAAGIWSTAIRQADSQVLESRKNLTRSEIIGIVADVIHNGLSARPPK
jgi:AcrR family transcriptional regulator|tara:strand:+ start:439 stop:1068 length:630 start_codon:yes stop_codon:yes gene_type:complete